MSRDGGGVGGGLVTYSSGASGGDDPSIFNVVPADGSLADLFGDADSARGRSVNGDDEKDVVDEDDEDDDTRRPRTAAGGDGGGSRPTSKGGRAYIQGGGDPDDDASTEHDDRRAERTTCSCSCIVM